MGCDHNCESCGGGCGKGGDSLMFALNAASRVKKVIAVASGKGGVGKSFVTATLAAAAARRGLKVGVLDADITGPSIPRAFKIGHEALQGESGIVPPVSESGVRVMSLNVLVENPSDPVVWRGPVIAGAVKQFWEEVEWGELDVMFVDMPPGTGDVPLTVFQSLPLDGVVIVSSPQELVGMIVEKSVRMAGMLNRPVLALVENMSYLECPDCGRRIEVFGPSRVEEVAAKYGIPRTARLPINRDFALTVDAGRVETLFVPEMDELAAAICGR